jgi:hypothetical protein
MPLSGCSNDVGGGPVISSLSTPSDASVGMEPEQDPNSEVAHSDGEEDPIISMIPTSTGVTAHLTWDPPTERNVNGYKIYYRKQPSEEQRSEGLSSEESSSEEPSACSYQERQTVEAPPATITGLEPNTQYVFAISAFTDTESICSNEITAVTPLLQS